MSEHPLLYSYRRCPYAMRARMALVAAKIQCQVQEIDFKNKPAAMLAISPKGTVPVLQRLQEQVIEESLDIVFWALQQHDPEGFLTCDIAMAKNLIAENDGGFKKALDRYKYSNRFPDEDCTQARDNGLEFLQKLEDILILQKNLIGQTISVADICIFPFVRQFVNVDKDWFNAHSFPYLKVWLASHIHGDLFIHIMKKYKQSAYMLL